MSKLQSSTIVRRTLADEAPLSGTRGEPLSGEEIVRYELFSKVSRSLLDKNPGSVWLRTYEPGEIICRQGEYGSTAFYIHSGNVRVSIDAAGRTHAAKPKRGFFGRLFGAKESTRHPHSVPADASQNLDHKTLTIDLGPGDFFGEMTCLSFLPRAATVIAIDKVYCIEMLRNILLLLFDNKDQKAWRTEKKKFLRANPNATFATPRPADTPVQKVYRDRALFNDIRACPLFAQVPADALKRLADSADFVSLEPGEPVFREGDDADDLFIVRRGFVKISRADGDSEVVLNYLSKGQYFGEIALLGAESGRSTKRTATCTALGNVDLIAIGREDVAGLLDAYPDFRRQLRQISEARQSVPKAPPIKSGFNFAQYLDQELMQGTSLLLFDLERCTRCDECVRACADSHGGVTRLKREGMRFDKYLVPTSCRSCRDPVCLTECPVGSIGRSPSGAIIIEDWCIGCRKCEENCPYGNIEMQLFGANGSTEIYKQQSPVRLGRIGFDAPPGFADACLPVGLEYDARRQMLTYADVPGVAGEEELRAVCADGTYQHAIDALLRQVQTRVTLPILPGDFKPSKEIEGVVKLKRASKAEPENAIVFRGIVNGANQAAYRSASSDTNYLAAVDQLASETRGMRAVLSKAAVCDLCESVDQTPNCVYACPHDAAFRVDADSFFKSTGSSE